MGKNEGSRDTSGYAGNGTCQLKLTVRPGLAADCFLTDGGLETTLIFHEGLKLPHFAASPLLSSDGGRAALGGTSNPTQPRRGSTKQGSFWKAPCGEPTGIGAARWVTVWFTDDSDGLHATIQVEDLAGLVAESGQVESSATFVATFRLEHADKSGPGGRNGEWHLRGDYQAGSSQSWSYWGEGPCLDGDDTDGCAGEDRHIIDPLPGFHDLNNSTVTVTIPWKHLGPVTYGDKIGALEATTQFV